MAQAQVQEVDLEQSASQKGGEEEPEERVLVLGVMVPYRGHNQGRQATRQHRGVPSQNPRNGGELQAGERLRGAHLSPSVSTSRQPREEASAHPDNAGCLAAEARLIDKIHRFLTVALRAGSEDPAAGHQQERGAEDQAPGKPLPEHETSHCQSHNYVPTIQAGEEALRCEAGREPADSVAQQPEESAQEPLALLPVRALGLLPSRKRALYEATCSSCPGRSSEV
mmetsp:Transcript_51918/g.110959  ORF Transcript_51918/g.110959 Transcript_51918/m.110959 type:complete len:225 (+) Transcript_51918:342-1016(+)